MEKQMRGFLLKMGSKKKIAGILACASAFFLTQSLPRSFDTKLLDRHSAIAGPLDTSFVSRVVFSTPLVTLPQITQRCLEGLCAFLFGLLWIGPGMWSLLFCLFLLSRLKKTMRERMGWNLSWPQIGVGVLGLCTILLFVSYVPWKSYGWSIPLALVFLMGIVCLGGYHRWIHPQNAGILMGVLMGILGLFWMPLPWIGIGLLWACVIWFGFWLLSSPERVQKIKPLSGHGFLTSFKV